jgi:hypothetical protein
MMRDLSPAYITQAERRLRQRGEARDLERKWLAGEGNTSDRNFTTQGDRENPRSFEQDLGDLGEDTLK